MYEWGVLTLWIKDESGGSDGTWTRNLLRDRNLTKSNGLYLGIIRTPFLKGEINASRHCVNQHFTGHISGYTSSPVRVRLVVQRVHDFLHPRIRNKPNHDRPLLWVSARCRLEVMSKQPCRRTINRHQHFKTGLEIVKRFRLAALSGNS